jgi:hypothetical protein
VIRVLRGGDTAAHDTVHESLLVSVTVIVGAEGVSTAQNVAGRDLSPSPISVIEEIEIEYEEPEVTDVKG